MQFIFFFSRLVFQYELDRNILGSSISFANSNNDIPDVYYVDLGMGTQQQPNIKEDRHEDINDIEQAMQWRLGIMDLLQHVFVPKR